tara:strand:+ start:569 stop:760 length:192 start_codon:yes stop_codon:yes gene_type:complete
MAKTSHKFLKSLNLLYNMLMKTLEKWTKPKINLIGSASRLIKDIDVDGTSDANFPNNLQSDGV